MVQVSLRAASGPKASRDGRVRAASEQRVSSDPEGNCCGVIPGMRQKAELA